LCLARSRCRQAPSGEQRCFRLTFYAAATAAVVREMPGNFRSIIRDELARARKKEASCRTSQGRRANSVCALDVRGSLSTRRHSCLFIVRANESEVINYRLTRVDEGGRESPISRRAFGHARPCTLRIDSISGICLSQNSAARYTSFAVSLFDDRARQLRTKGLRIIANDP